MCKCAWCSLSVPAAETELMQMGTGLILPVCRVCIIKYAKRVKK